jgi:hypothetical protein
MEFAMTADEVYEPTDPIERAEWEHFKSLTVGVEPECIVLVPRGIAPEAAIFVNEERTGYRGGCVLFFKDLHVPCPGFPTALPLAEAA